MPSVTHIPRPQEVGVILARIREGQAGPAEADKLALLLESATNDERLMELIQTTAELKGRAIRVLETIEPTYKRGVDAWERQLALEEAKRKDAIDEREENKQQRKHEAEQAEQEREFRKKNIYRPLIGAAVGLLVGLIPTIPSVLEWIASLFGN